MTKPPFVPKITGCVKKNLLIFLVWAYEEMACFCRRKKAGVECASFPDGFCLSIHIQQWHDIELLKAMNHLATLVSPILKIVNKAYPTILRRYYTKDKLDSLLKFDISASGDGVTYYHPSQEGSCWMTVTNLSLFDFTIDKLEISVLLEGTSFSCGNTIPCSLKSRSVDRLLAKGKSPMLLEAAQFAKEKTKSVRVEISAYIVSTIHLFDVKRIISDVKNFQLLV